jgi:parallel beta-helix repeat protein
MKKHTTKLSFNILIAAILVLLSFSVYSAERQIVVAASGGDFTTIQEALASIEPTKENPYVIDVMPGKYKVRNAQMKSYVHLRGAGRKVTTISHYGTPATNVLALVGLQDVTISGFTFLGDGSPFGGFFGNGLHINDSMNVTVTDNTFDHLYQDIYVTAGSNYIIKNNIFNDANYGIVMYLGEAIVENNQFSGMSWSGIHSTGSSVIKGNIITDSYGVGIYLAGEKDAAPVVSGNTITGNNANGIECHYLVDPTATITGNVITNNSGYGAYMYYCSPILTNNRITGNAGADIQLHASTFNGSFNVFDTWSGGGVIAGSYNVNTAGQPIQ